MEEEDRRELGIIAFGRSWRHYSELVRINRISDDLVFYEPYNGGRETFCKIECITVRNATPELFRALKETEEKFERRKAEAFGAMEAQYASESAALIEAAQSKSGSGSESSSVHT